MTVINSELLKDIAENPDNILYNYIHPLKNPQDEYTHLNINGRKTQVIGAKTSYEFMITAIVLGVKMGLTRSFYISESSPDQDGTRADLFYRHPDDGRTMHIIEFKNLGKKVTEKELKTTIDNAFTQVKNKYISSQKNEMFVSIVIADAEELVTNPHHIGRFEQTGVYEKTHDLVTVYNELGFLIVTKKYNPHDNNYTKDNWYDLPNFIKSYRRVNNNGINLPDHIAIRAIDAITTPTKSSGEFISNVRDILDPALHKGKEGLVVDVAKTLAVGAKNKDSEILLKFGNSKEFIYVEHDTIHFAGSKNNHAIIAATMNGAIVDGQNSIHAVGLIISTIKQSIETDFKPTPWQKKVLFEFNSRGLISSHLEKNDVIRFLEELSLKVNWTRVGNVTEARLVAVSKNKNVPVPKNNIATSELKSETIALSNALMAKYNYNLTYPKKSNECIPRSVPSCSIDEIAAVHEGYVYAIKMNTKQADMGLVMFDVSSKVSKIDKVDNLKNLFKSCTTIEVIKSNEAIEQSLENDFNSGIKELTGARAAYENTIKSLEEVKKTNPAIGVALDDNISQNKALIADIDVQIANIEAEMAEWQANNSLNEIRVVHVSNLKYLAELFNIKNLARTAVNNLAGAIPGCIKGSEAFTNYVTAVLIGQLVGVDLDATPELSLDLVGVTKTVNNLVSNMNDWYDEYGDEITTIRNKTNAQITNTKTKAVIDAISVRNQFFGFEPLASKVSLVPKANAEV